MDGTGDSGECQLELEGKQLLVKQSYVNGCLTELRTQVVDELQCCVFLRVVRVGQDLEENKEKSGLSVGSLVALHERALGSPLKSPSLDSKIPHYIVKYSDVVGVLEF